MFMGGKLETEIAQEDGGRKSAQDNEDNDNIDKFELAHRKPRTADGTMR